MDDIDAPQWADFTAPSPQVSSDDFFFRKHNEHEYRDKLDSVDSNSPNILFKKQPLTDSVLDNDTIIYKTPIRVMSTKGGKKSASSKKNNLKETTYENVLMEAMSNLQLSFKKGDKSFNKSCLIDSPAFKTPVRVTRSMCAQVNTSKQNLEESHCTSLISKESRSKHDHCDDDKENLNTEKQESSENEQSSQIHLEFTTSGSEHEISHDKSEDITGPKSEPSLELKLESDSESKEPELELNSIEDSEAKEPDLELNSIEDSVAKSESNKVNPNQQMNNSKHVSKNKVSTSFAADQSNSGSGKKKPSVLAGTAWHRQLKRRMSITNQKRLSIAKPQASTKYVSMAEAVTKFQRATPQRFRSTTVKSTRTEQLRRSFKLTQPTSPALQCKTRTRPVTVLSREEQEQLELEKLRQNQIKANPVRKNILNRAAPLKKVEKKMVTNPEPFHLTETKKGQLLSKQNQEIRRAPRTFTKTVPSIVSTDDQSVIVKQEEILHFGIPLDPCKKKKSTKVMPFSFEARNRELQQKKQEKLKFLQETTKQKVKADFHARPVPIAVKTPLKPVKDNSLHKPKITLTRSLSFEARVKEVQKKKEEKLKQMLEEEKKARSFKAQKAPEFKPVLVRGRSKDNLLKRSNENLNIKPHNVSGSTNKKIDSSLKKSQENLVKKQPNSIKKPMIPFVAPKKTSPASVSSENQENRPQGAVPKILEPKCKLSQKSAAVLSELNTDKRAKQRKEFEDQIKKKEMEEEEMKKKEEVDRIAKEKAQKSELRKMTEIKARPMPVYKQLNIVKSNKPLTDAQSPAWASKRKGSMH